MLVYAGIDEAGYGPMFGPFVVARSVFTMENGSAGEAPPCLWKAMSRAVCRGGADRRRRIAVNDSKKLYSPATGLGHLERAVLSFAELAGRPAHCLEQLLTCLGEDGASRTPDLLWYADEAGGPALPTCWTQAELAISRAMLRRGAEQAGLRIVDLRAAVVYEDRFNRIIAATRSKGRCAWQFVSQHLWWIWREYGEHHPRVVVDRQGGRKVYHELLALLFDGASVKLLDESDDVSCYELRLGDRAMTVSFETESEATHLPVALASMTAKYVRELLMHRFNAFWARHDPRLKPTAGYVQDGRRFLSDIEPLIATLRIDRCVLIRCR